MHPPLANLSLKQEVSPLLQVPGYTTPRNYSEHTARAIDEAVSEIVASAFKRALEVLTRHRATLETAAARLLERETLIEADMAGIATELASARQQFSLPKAA